MTQKTKQAQEIENKETPEQREKRHEAHHLFLTLKAARSDAKRRFGRNGGADLDRQGPPGIRCRVGVLESIVLKPAHCRDQKAIVVRSLRVKGVGLTWSEAFDDSRKNDDRDRAQAQRREDERKARQKAAA